MGRDGTEDIHIGVQGGSALHHFVYQRIIPMLHFLFSYISCIPLAFPFHQLMLPRRDRCTGAGSDRGCVIASLRHDIKGRLPYNASKSDQATDYL